MGSIGQVYFPTLSRAWSYLKPGKHHQSKKPDWAQLWTLQAKEISASYSDVPSIDRRAIFNFTNRLNELAIGNRPLFTITEQDLHSGSIGCYEWALDIIRFDQRVVELSSGKPFEVAAHETRHRMVLHRLAFPCADFSRFSEYISPSEIEMLKIKVQERYPRQAWEGELDAFVIGHVANKMYEAGRSLEDIATLVSSSSHSIPYFDGFLHMLIKIDPQPKEPIMQFVSSNMTFRREYLARPFSIKDYFLGILAMRIRFPSLDTLSNLANILKGAFSGHSSLNALSFRSSFGIYS
ncbi:hypothetical protein ACFL4J_00380 [Candidatus Margulisiibacteriota bacterium]